MKQDAEPLFVMRAGGLRLVDNVALGVSFLLAVSAVVIGHQNIAIVGVAIAAIMVFFVWLIVPRRFEVWPQRLRIVFPVLRWSLRFDSIEDVQASRPWQPYAFMGYRFATAPGQALTVYRRRANLLLRPNVVFSPEDRGEFLAELRLALWSYRNAADDESA